jgi:hypothetical protein
MILTQRFGVRGESGKTEHARGGTSGRHGDERKVSETKKEESE